MDISILTDVVKDGQITKTMQINIKIRLGNL